MPVYAYKGVTSAGKNTRGQVSAENLKAARQRMRRDGIFLTNIGETSVQSAAATTNGDAEAGDWIRAGIYLVGRGDELVLRKFV